MRTPVAALTLLLGCSGLAVAVLPDGVPEADRVRRVAEVRPGVPAARVRQTLGEPNRLARQILYHRYFEQWVYEAPPAVRVEFECRRGQEAQVQSIRPLRPARP